MPSSDQPMKYSLTFACHSFISIFNQTFFSQSNVTTSLQSKVHLNNTIYQVIDNQNQLNSLLTLKGHTKHFLNNITVTLVLRGHLWDNEKVVL